MVGGLAGIVILEAHRVGILKVLLQHWALLTNQQIGKRRHVPHVVGVKMVHRVREQRACVAGPLFGLLTVLRRNGRIR